MDLVKAHEENKVEETNYQGWLLLGETWQKFSDVSISIDGLNCYCLGNEKIGFGGYAIYQYQNN